MGMPSSRERLQLFRNIAMLGGAFFGAAAGIAITGPSYGDFAASRIAWVIGGCVVLGTITGFLAVEISLRMRGGDEAPHSTHGSGARGSGGDCETGSEGADE